MRANPYSLQLLEVCHTSASVVPLDYLRLAGYLHLTTAVAASVASLQPTALCLDHYGQGENPPDQWRADIATYATLELLQKCLPSLHDLELVGLQDYLPTSALQCLHLGTGLCSLDLDFTEEDGDTLLNNHCTWVALWC
jgi:hypothetical protein